MKSTRFTKATTLLSSLEPLFSFNDCWQVDFAGIRSKCWTRSDLPSDLDQSGDVEWLPGHLADKESMKDLVDGCDAVVHAGLSRSGRSFQVREIDVVEFACINILGTLELIEAARAAGIKRFVFVSTCAVHDHILSDRPLNEAHPLWANTHYGAPKAAIEKFVHSYGLGSGFPICSLRPTGIYSLANPLENSKWFKPVEAVVRGVDVQVSKDSQGNSKQYELNHWRAETAKERN